MIRILSKAVGTASALTFFALAVNAQTATDSGAKAVQTLDCYSSAGSLQSLGEYTFQASGYCQTQCVDQNQFVMATTDGSTCLCGNELPPDSAKVEDSKCSEPCNGYDLEYCGGKGYYQIYLTGLGTPETAEDDSSSASPTSSKPQTTTSAKPSVVTKAGQTIIVTASATSDPESSSSSGGGGGGGSGGSSKVGIAVGAVVGVIAVAAIVGGIILFLKRRKNKAIEEEHRRNAAVSSFVKGANSETSSTTDHRLDPKAFSHRRESLGSIADERDFSRRILQV